MIIYGRKFIIRWSTIVQHYNKIYDKAHSLGGLVSGDHGIGLAKKPYLKETTNPASAALLRGIKQAFDPNNILNPGKICFD